MELVKAEELAVSLMKEHGIWDNDWRFKWSNGKNRFGYAQIKTVRSHWLEPGKQIKTISLSKTLTSMNDEEVVRDVILHEIAHALAGLRNGHNHVWKAACIKIGAKPERLINAGEANFPKEKWELLCTCCDRVLRRTHRRMNKHRLMVRYCKRCGVDSQGKLTYVHAMD